MVKVLIASLIVGTILDHFGIRIDELLKPPAFRPTGSRPWRAKGSLGRCQICCSVPW
jgi:hypothetical protein